MGLKIKNLKREHRVYNRFPRKTNRPLKAVSVARTVEAPQPPFEDFLNSVGRELGRRAIIRTITSTRVTFVESGGIRRELVRAHSDNKAVQRFSFWMSGQLDQYRGTNMDATIDTKESLKLMGRRGNKLALGIIPSDFLTQQRDLIEELLAKKFEHLPKLKAFDPHLTVGEVHLASLTPAEQERPELLIPETLIPEIVALNGLSVFLGDRNLKH